MSFYLIHNSFIESNIAMSVTWPSR